MKNKKKKKKKKKNRKSIQQFHLNKNSTFTFFEVVLFIFISIIFGMIIGCILTYHTSSISSIRADSHLREIVSTYLNIKDNYYKKIKDEDLTNAAVKGMIEELGDPYSMYLDSYSTDSFTESVDGRYVGIGVSVLWEEDYFKIVSVNADGPADKAGILENDIILAVDGKDCNGITTTELTKLIRGKNHTSVLLKIKREDKELEITVKREYIDIQVVHNKVFDGKIGYISMDMFASNSYEQFQEALQKLEKKKIDSLIIDLRSNPGGHLYQVKKILDLFLPRKTILYRIEEKGKISKIYSSTKESRNYPIVVLINKSSASASEVLAVSLQENYPDCKIVGVNSYGKGTVQKSQTLSTGTSIKYTIERWLSPSAIDINGVGVTPDVYVEQSSDYYKDYLEEHDTQLQEAILQLKKES